MTNWLPDISSAQSTKYLALADAISVAVKDGTLSAGSKMPPQRNLAYDIGVTLGTVSRAYREAERRGLIGGEVGRGTFVLDPDNQTSDTYFPIDESTSAALIDLARSSPIQGMVGKVLSETLADISREPNIDALCNYELNTGLESHIEAGANWLSSQGLNNAKPDNIAITSGAQHGVLVSLMSAANPGDTILVDPLTYPGITNLARKLGYRLETVRGDEDGMLPEALSEACRRHAPSVLYLMPNLQNPTATSMPTDRRHQIAAVAEKFGLFVIEDDIWGPLVKSNSPYIANILPEQTFYLSSFSKCIAGGIRIGYALAPRRLNERLRSSVRMTSWMAAPLMAEIARRWITNGKVTELIKWQRDQIDERSQAVLACLKDYKTNHYPGSHHIWLHLPEPWTARDFKNQAQDRGVVVIGADAFAVERNKAPEAIRIGIGRPDTLYEVMQGASRLADILDQGPEDNFNIL